jgi:hypothetical protein
MKNNENENMKIEIIKKVLKHKICCFIYCINDHDAKLLAFANTHTHLWKKYDAKNHDKTSQRLRQIE